MEGTESITTKIQCLTKRIHQHPQVSIVETSEHAAKTYLSTIAVLQLDAILTGARKVSIKKTKPGNKNQQPFERMMIMEYELAYIGKIKMTVGIRRRTHEKVQYCITAIQSI